MIPKAFKKIYIQYTQLCIMRISANSFIQMLDIKHYACSGQSITDDVKHQLLENREPEKSFNFPPKQYAMKLSKTGYVNRYCSREWFKKFDFISYSKSEDGLHVFYSLIHLIVAPRN